jgi:hypothetical protein
VHPWRSDASRTSSVLLAGKVACVGSKPAHAPCHYLRHAEVRVWAIAGTKNNVIKGSLQKFVLNNMYVHTFVRVYKGIKN